MLERIGKLFVMVMLIIVMLLNPEVIIAENKSVKFNDIDSNFWAKDIIDWAINEDLVVGFPDGTFRPNQQVTEAQFMTMIYRYLKLNKIEGKEESTESNEEKSHDRIYDRLRNIGIMASGTNYKEVRQRVINQEEAASVILSTFTDNDFITDKERIIQFLEEVGVIEGNQFEYGQPLTRISALSIINAFHKKGGKLDVKSEVDPELGLYELHYFGDWNKRIFYHYPDTGLIISVTEIKSNFEKEQNYYENIRGKSISLNEGKDNYLINISSIHGKGIDFYGYAVLIADDEGSRMVEERKDFIGLRGNSQLTTLVSGTNIKDLKLVLGKNVIDVHMNNLKEFPGKRFFSDRGYGLEWNMFYVGTDVIDTFDQVERHIFESGLD